MGGKGTKKACSSAALITTRPIRKSHIVPRKVVSWTQDISTQPTSDSLDCPSERCSSRRGHLIILDCSCLLDYNILGAEF